MTPQQIQQMKALIKSERQKDELSSRFQLSQIPTGYIKYGGLIGLDGAIGFLPNGWTIDPHDTTGDYLITHNLNTLIYSVVAFPVANQFVGMVTNNLNEVEFDWVNLSNVLTDTPFYFEITVFSNNKSYLPLYPPTEYTTTGILI